MFIFPDRESTMHLPKIFNIYFTQGIYLKHREDVEVLKIKEHTRVMVRCVYNIVAFSSKF